MFASSNYNLLPAKAGLRYLASDKTMVLSKLHCRPNSHADRSQRQPASQPKTHQAYIPSLGYVIERPSMLTSRTNSHSSLPTLYILQILCDFLLSPLPKLLSDACTPFFFRLAPFLDVFPRANYFSPRLDCHLVSLTGVRGFSLLENLPKAPLFFIEISGDKPAYSSVYAP